MQDWSFLAIRSILLKISWYFICVKSLCVYFTYSKGVIGLGNRAILSNFALGYIETRIKVHMVFVKFQSVADEPKSVLQKVFSKRTFKFCSVTNMLFPGSSIWNYHPSGLAIQEAIFGVSVFKLKSWLTSSTL